jgi:hypothetical protein
LEIEFLKVISFLLAAVSADWGNIQHAIPKLHESAAFYGDVQVCYIMQDEIDELLQLLITEEFLQGLDSNNLSILVGNQPILGKKVIILIFSCNSSMLESGM